MTACDKEIFQFLFNMYVHVFKRIHNPKIEILPIPKSHCTYLQTSPKCLKIFVKVRFPHLGQA